MFNKKEEQKNIAEMSNSSNTISKGTTVNGDIETFGNIRIEGAINGNIVTKSKASLGHSCEMTGDLLAQNAVIEGNIKGTVEVAELLILKPSAVIDGDIITNKLIVESGAKFNGGCKMGATVKKIEITGEKSERKPLIKA